MHGPDDQAREFPDRETSHAYGGAPVNNQKCGIEVSELSLCNGTDRLNKN